LWVDNDREARFSDLEVTAVHAATEVATAPAAPAGPTAPTAPAAPTSPAPVVTPPVAPTPPHVATPPEVWPPHGRPMFSERFDAPQMQWQQDAQRTLRGGAMELTSPTGQFVVAGVADARYGDYIVRTEAERLDGPPDGRWGLLVRLQPDGRCGYLLAFTADGGCAVIRVDSDGVALLGRGATTLHAGPHTLWARCAGSALTFGVDGVKLLTVQDGAYSGGGFGLYADNGTQARFTQLVAEALP
jgi:hypothetical protein